MIASMTSRISETSEERYGDWMSTNSGRRYYPLDPRPSDVIIEDIAHSLGHICRYGGHPNDHYSVAEHAWILSYLCEEAQKALNHDDSEAYIGDIIRPLKHMPEVYKFYKPIEVANERVIAQALGLSSLGNEEVDFLDHLMPSMEAPQLFDFIDPEWMSRIEEQRKMPELQRLFSVKIKCWSPKEAKEKFLERYYELKANGN